MLRVVKHGSALFPPLFWVAYVENWSPRARVQQARFISPINVIMSGGIETWTLQAATYVCLAYMKSVQDTTHLPHKTLSRPRFRGNIIAAYKMFTAGLDLDISLFFVLSARPGLKDRVFKVLQGLRRGLRRSTPSSIQAAKFWNRLSTSIVTTPSINALIRQRCEMICPKGS